MSIDKLSPNQKKGKVAYSKVVNDKLDEVIDRINNIDESIELGSGSTVTQATSITTGVTINAHYGIIRTVTATTAAATTTGFTVANEHVTSSSTIILTLQSYGGTFITNGTPLIYGASLTDGSFDVKITNIHAANALNGVLQISFIVLNNN